MKQLMRSALIVAGAVALAGARTPAAPNPLQVVIANGPFAGTYDARGAETICLHAKAQKMYAASFKDFNAHGAKAFAEGGIKVDNPDAPDKKFGDLHAAFGVDPNSVQYDVYNVPITMTPKGKGADLAGAGKTKDGIQMRVTASCQDLETM
jgi:hypothetical protein